MKRWDLIKQVRERELQFLEEHLTQLQWNRQWSIAVATHRLAQQVWEYFVSFREKKRLLAR